MSFFLLIYDRQARRIVELRSYEPEDHAQALQDRFRRELEERLNPSIEVVLFAAESLDALKHTHRRYFMRKDDDRMAGAV